MAPATLPTMGVTDATVVMDVPDAQGWHVPHVANRNSELGPRSFYKMLTTCINNVKCILKQ